MRVEPALLAFLVFEAVELDCTLADAGRAEAGDAAGISEQLPLDAHALLAVAVDDDLWPALAIGGIDVFLPEREGFEDVSVGVDGVVGASHDPAPSKGAGRRW